MRPRQGLVFPALLLLWTDWRLFLIALAVFVIVYLLTKRISLCALAAAVSYPLFSLILGAWWLQVLLAASEQYPNAVIVCTGGRSYPSTGSTGDGYRFARETGHSVREARPSLVPLVTREDWCRQLQGLALKNVALTVRPAEVPLAAGADILYMPEDFEAAYNGLLAAAADGTLPESRIDASLERIFRVKLAGYVE